MDKHSIAAYLEYLGASVPSVGHGWRKIKCPFHDDGHASAGINFEEQRFKCHGCGVGGDVYDLIMYKEGGNYREAVQFAEAISPTGNTRVHKKHTHSSAVSSDSRLIGRRSAAVSYRSSQGRSSRS
jgi:DNA primase